MDTSTKIRIIIKQNDSIYQSLQNKGINFERANIAENLDIDEQLQILTGENTKLKECSKINKPQIEVKKVKEDTEVKVDKVIKEVKVDKKDKVIKEVKEDDCENEDNYDEPVKKFDIIANMEELKRAFFNGNYEIFEEQLKLNSYKYYKVDYKYNSDKDGAPDFAAKNLLKGFVRNFDDYRKYFMICFRCLQLPDKKYEYNSLWIVNTNEQIQNIIGSLYDDFTFVELVELIDLEPLKKFIKDIRKIDSIDDTNYIGESYVH